MDNKVKNLLTSLDRTKEEFSSQKYKFNDLQKAFQLSGEAKRAASDLRGRLKKELMQAYLKSPALESVMTPIEAFQKVADKVERHLDEIGLDIKDVNLDKAEKEIQDALNLIRKFESDLKSL